MPARQPDSQWVATIAGDIRDRYADIEQVISATHDTADAVAALGAAARRAAIDISGYERILSEGITMPELNVWDNVDDDLPFATPPANGHHVYTGDDTALVVVSESGLIDPVVTGSSDQLVQMAATAVNHLQAAAAHFVEACVLVSIIKAQRSMSHAGTWAEFVDDNFPFTLRTANRYAGVGQLVREALGEQADFAALDFQPRAMYRLIKSDVEPGHAQRIIVEAAEKGSRLSRSLVDAQLATAERVLYQYEVLETEPDGSQLRRLAFEHNLDIPVVHALRGLREREPELYNIVAATDHIEVDGEQIHLRNCRYQDIFAMASTERRERQQQRLASRREVSLTLDDHRPKSWNQFYSGRHWSVRRNYRDEIRTLVRAALAWYDGEPLTPPVEVKVRSEQRGRTIDASNITTKVYEDALKGVLIVDDNPDHVRRVVAEAVRADRDRVIITVRELGIDNG